MDIHTHALCPALLAIKKNAALLAPLVLLVPLRDTPAQSFFQRTYTAPPTERFLQRCHVGILAQLLLWGCAGIMFLMLHIVPLFKKKLSR